MNTNEYNFTAPLPKKSHLNSQFTAVAAISKSLNGKQGVWAERLDAAPELCPDGSRWEPPGVHRLTEGLSD